MKKSWSLEKNWPILLLSAGLLGIALSFPVQAMIVYKIPFSQIDFALQMLTPINWLAAVLLAITSLCLFRASRWIYAVMTLNIFVVSLNNMVVGMHSPDFNFVQTQLATFGFIGLSAISLHPKSVLFFFNNELRAKRLAKRKLKRYPLLINNGMSGLSFDLSKSGLFFETSDSEKLSIGQCVTIKLRKNGSESLEFAAKVVRISGEAKGKYPKGVGCQILPFSDLESLNGYCQILAT